jgi:hypothetical protein
MAVHVCYLWGATLTWPYGNVWARGGGEWKELNERSNTRRRRLTVEWRRTVRKKAGSGGKLAAIFFLLRSKIGRTPDTAHEYQASIKIFTSFCLFHLLFMLSQGPTGAQLLGNN